MFILSSFYHVLSKSHFLVIWRNTWCYTRSAVYKKFRASRIWWETLTVLCWSKHARYFSFSKMLPYTILSIDAYTHLFLHFHINSYWLNQNANFCVLFTVPVRTVDPSKDLNSYGLGSVDWKERVKDWKVKQDKNMLQMTTKYTEGKPDIEGTGSNGDDLQMFVLWKTYVFAFF